MITIINTLAGLMQECLLFQQPKTEKHNEYAGKRNTTPNIETGIRCK